MWERRRRRRRATTLTTTTAAKRDLDILMVFLVASGLWGGPLGRQMGDVPPQEGDWVRQIRGTLQVTDFRWLFPSLPMKTAAKWDLDISVVFLVALGLWGGPLGRWMVNVPPQKGYGVGLIIFELFGSGVDFLLIKMLNLMFVRESILIEALYMLIKPDQIITIISILGCFYIYSIWGTQICFQIRSTLLRSKDMKA